MEIKDINIEYERTFGVTQRPTLYAPDDVEYLSLYREILAAPREFNHTADLPFEGVCLLPYDDFSRKQGQAKYQILDIINSLLLRKREYSEEPSQNGKHIFFIKFENICEAFGYYEEDTNCFVVMKGTTFSTNPVTKVFAETSVGIARQQFIKVACEKIGSYYKVIKDTRCKSANAAASYMLGKLCSYVYWKDSKGYYLKDIFPSRFKQSEIENKKGTCLEKEPSSIAKKHFFYLQRNSVPNRSCNAKGYYDIDTKKFVLIAGSLLSLETTSTYNNSVAGIARRNFVNKFCIRIDKNYRLKQDVIFDSPNLAAAVVVGASANGWRVWRDSLDRTLYTIYRL